MYKFAVNFLLIFQILKMKKFKWIVIVTILLILSIIGGIFSLSAYQSVYGVNVVVTSYEPVFVHIPTNSTFDDVCDLLEDAGLQDVESFRWVSQMMNYSEKVKSGRYRVLDGTNNLELIRMLRSGRQVPVKVIFNNIRLNAQFAGAATRTIEADSASLLALLNDGAYLAENFNLAPQTILSLCLPNTYELFWNTSAKGLLDRMAKEYERFWTDSRREKAAKAGLTPLQVSVLASIIEEETHIDSEKATMAGVYINRLNIGMKLQADPTLKYAAGDFAIKRVLDVHKEIESPYNTYMYAGLPPGPICCPSIASIEAVLNYEKHDYLFFCAKADFSGAHNFTRTLAQHNRNAKEYRQALNQRAIY